MSVLFMVPWRAVFGSLLVCQLPEMCSVPSVGAANPAHAFASEARRILDPWGDDSSSTVNGPGSSDRGKALCKQV